jgi:hypothetical protein
MLFSLKHSVRAATASALIYLFTVPQGAFAQSAEHLVSPADMQTAVANAAQTRRQNIDTLNQFFSSDKASEALRASHMDPQQVKTAVAGLSDQELAQLATRADKAQKEFAAGNMNDHDLLLILVVIAALILVIVAVH